MKKVALPAPVKARGTLLEYYDKLEKDGWKFAGAGAGGKVYTKGKFALKVSEDEAYDHFLEYALAHQNNPWFPKIYSVDRYEDVYYNKADKLFSTVKPKEWNRKWFGEWNPSKGNNYTVTLMEKLEFKKGTYQQRNKVSTALEQTAKEINWGLKPPMKKMGRSQKQAAKVLAELFKEHSPDLHDRNIMYRGKQLVIIDPVWC